MAIHAEESVQEITARLEMLLASVRKNDIARVAMLSQMLSQELRRLITPAGGARMGNVQVYPANRMGFTTTEIRDVWKLVNGATKLFNDGEVDGAFKALERAIALTQRHPQAFRIGSLHPETPESLNGSIGTAAEN